MHRYVEIADKESSFNWVKRWRKCFSEHRENPPRLVVRIDYYDFYLNVTGSSSKCVVLDQTSHTSPPGDCLLPRDTKHQSRTNILPGSTVQQSSATCSPLNSHK